MSAKKLLVFLVCALSFSGAAFGQIYQKELQAYDLPGLQKKLGLIDAAIPTEPVVAYLLSYYSQYDERPISQLLSFLDGLKAAKANLNQPTKDDPSGTPLVLAVRKRVDASVVDWLIKNGARWGTRNYEDSLIDDALLQHDYRIAKLLIGLNETLPAKQKLSVMDGFAPKVAALKDDVAGVKKALAAAKTDISGDLWAAAVVGGSPKVFAFLMALYDPASDFAKSSDMEYPLLGNSEFLKQWFAAGYHIGSPVGLMESALESKEYDSLAMVIANGKAGAWDHNVDFWTKLAKTNFPLFLSATNNCTEIVVPDDATNGDVSAYQKFFYGDTQQFSDFGIIDILLKQADPGVVKALVKRCPPADYQFARLNRRMPDLGAALLAIDDSGTLQALLDADASKNAPQQRTPKEN